MIDKNNEVLFGEYCKTCKYKNYSETDSPCAECLAEPVNLYSHKPVKWEGADGIYAGPPPRPDHAYQRAVKYVPENRKDREKAIARQNIDAEYTGNKVQTIDDKVTDDQYPSATAVKKALEGANEVTAQSLARKIDAPDTCECGEFLAVEEVNEDGVVTKVKGAKVQTDPPDLSENDPTKPGYVKNRTHYDSREIKTIEKTFENITETKLVKLADADIDINRIVSYSMSGTDGENTYNIIVTDILIDDISEMVDKPTGSVFVIVPNEGPGPILTYFAVPVEIPDQSDDGSDATVTYHGLYSFVDAVDILVKFEINIESGELKQIDSKFIPETDPSKIKDMYYVEEANVDAKGYTTYVPLQSTETAHGLTLPFETNQTWEITATNKYTSTVQQASDGTLYLGDPDISNPPFYITSTTSKANSGWMSMMGGISSCKIECLSNGNVIHTIDEKYFPNTIVTDETLQDKLQNMRVLTRDNFLVKTSGYSVYHGYDTTASGTSSHAEGYNSKSLGNYSHAEGVKTKASEHSSHSEGYDTTASGKYSHAEGGSTTASNEASHSEGFNTTASGDSSHAEGRFTTALGLGSHAEGLYTVANTESQHVHGAYNILDTEGSATKKGKYAHIVGNGTSVERSNAYTLDWDGNGWFAGDVYVGSTSGTKKDSGSKKLIKEGDDIIIQSSTEGSTKKFKITVDDSGTISATEVTA